MKRWFLLLALASLSGCVELDVWLKEKQKTEPNAPPSVTPTRVRIQVNPSDVTETNAPEMLRALREEVDSTPQPKPLPKK